MSHSVGDFREVPVLVCGDIMLDRQIYGHVRRISPEAPVPVVSLEREHCTPGGAGHVAASLAGLACRVTLAGLIGDDLEGDLLREALEKKGVTRLVTVPAAAAGAGLATISKTRILSDTHQQILRLDRDGHRDAFIMAAGALLEQVEAAIEGHKAVILSDYEKGTITPELVASVIGRCRERGIACVVDPKKADLGVYAGATVLAPNLHEAERAAGRPLHGDRAIAEAAEAFRVRYGLGAMLITRGAEGMTLAAGGEPLQIAAQARAVADVTGAGDTVVAVLAAGLAAGLDIVEGCRLASVAAGIAVSHPGTYVVRADELEPALRGRSPKVMERALARQKVTAARQDGRSIVFTNGCFDILHAGHLSSLERSRDLGDLLVVGLNSDHSVRCLKGETRPIIGQDNRAALLAGLACVDVVVIFDEETPETLIRAIEPDVLVKGGDYTIETVVGSDFVIGRGGRVVTLPLIPGLSTSSILAARS